VRLLQNLDGIARNLHPRDSRRHISVKRQVIKRNRHFLGGTCTDKEKQDANYLA
jgi:hypothetical protein